MRKIEFESGISNFWWVPLLTGLICVGLGIWTLAAPTTALIMLAYIFAAGLVVAGGINVIFSIAMSRYSAGWGWTLALGILELLSGIWLLALPETTVVSTFIFVVGFFIILAAINSLCEALSLSIFSLWWTIWAVVLLIATIVLGAIFLTNPIGGGVAVWLWISLSFITFGTYRIILAFRIARMTKE